MGHAGGIVGSLEKHQVDEARAVGELGYQAHRTALSHLVDTGDAAAQLDVGRGGVYLPDAVEAGPVDIPEREIIEEIAESFDVQFFAKQFCPLGAYARQELDSNRSSIAARRSLCLTYL